MLTSLLRVQTRTFSAARPAFAKKVKDGVPKKPLKPLDKSSSNTWANPRVTKHLDKSVHHPKPSTHPIISKTISTAAVGDKKETPETPKDGKAEGEAKQTAENEALKKSEEAKAAEAEAKKKAELADDMI